MATGSRPLPSYLGGGDLDGEWQSDCLDIPFMGEHIGDEYCCIEDPSLHPPTTAPPARYAPAQRLTLDRRCTMSDVADFVTDYFSSDVSQLFLKYRVFFDNFFIT